VSETTAPVEITTTYVTSVATLPEAWAFVMEHIDKLGPRPTVRVDPRTIYAVNEIGDDDARGESLFEVLVSGMREER
jgi:hypothetical protein